MWRRFTPLLLAVTISVGSGTDRSARALGEGEAERQQQPAPAPVQMHTKGVRLTDRQIDHWIFASDGDGDSARMLIESRLRSRIGYIDQLCGLSPQQCKKLEVAGRGDIKRFFDRVEEKRTRFHNGEARQADGLMQDILEMQRMGNDYRAKLFDDGSMFEKVLGMTLDPQQAGRYRKNRDDVRLARHQSRVEWVALTLQKNLMLNDGQRVRLLAVLLEETLPPRRFGPSDYYGIMYQATRVPETRLRPIFAEAEWRALQREFDDARRQERVLKDFGYLPDPDDRPDGKASRDLPEQGKAGGQAVLSRAASERPDHH